MSTTFEQYSDKSFVVRGDKLDKASERKNLTQKLQGNCIWNTRLKGGKGLLVAVNDHNRNELEKACGDHSDEQTLPDAPTDSVEVETESLDVVVKPRSRRSSSRDRDDRVDDRDERDERVDREERDDRSDRDELLGDVRKSKKRHDTDEDSEQESFRAPKKSYRKSPRKSKEPLTPPRKNRRHRDSDSEQSDYDSPPRKRSSKKSSRNDSRTSGGRSSYHRSRSSASSSSDEDDSSEDERIQKSIRRRGKTDPDEKGEELDTPIDSDMEDVVSLSRRMRLMSRKLKSFEKLMGAAMESSSSSSSMRR